VVGAPQRLDARSAHILGLLAAAQLTTGFCNTLFSQTVAFAADEFGASEGAQGVAGSVVRVGIILTVLLLALADRIGRRRILVGTAVAAPLPARRARWHLLVVLAGIQTIARPVAIAPGWWSRSWPRRRCHRGARLRSERARTGVRLGSRHVRLGAAAGRPRHAAGVSSTRSASST
jgi:MFS family permease